MSWTDVEDAVQAWLVGATGYAGDHCIWANQSTPKPEEDYATLAFADVASLGACDGTAELTDLGRPAGQEVERRLQGWRELVLTINVFSTSNTGDTAAVPVLRQAMLRLNFEAVSQSLNDVGLGLHDLGTAQSLPLLSGSKFQSRGVCEARFYYIDTASDFTGYIATVEPPTGTFEGTVP